MQTSQLLSSVALFTSAEAALKLNITIIGASNGASTLECWQMETPFSASTMPGTIGSASALLGDAANITITVLPAGYDGGLHNAPHNQWVAFISGLAYISLPTNDTSTAYVTGGEFGLIFAADIADLSAQGHRTEYPGNTATAVLVIPTKDGLVPSHSILHYGPCTTNDADGIQGLADH